jgi:protein-S-isoprenylcysteine O-methyltransferase Ste14
MFIYILVGIKLEEKKLVITFGEEYRSYQKKVKQLIPYIL